MLESTADLRKHAALILTQTVQNKAMPLGNQTAMTEEERAENRPVDRGAALTAGGQYLQCDFAG